MREWLVIEDSRKNSVFAPEGAKVPRGYIPRDVAERALGRDLGGTQWFTAEEGDLMRAQPEWESSELSLPLAREPRPELTAIATRTSFWEIFGTVLMYPGALLLALNDPLMSKYAYPLFFFGTGISAIVVYKLKRPWLLSQYVVFTLINVLGLYNWLLR